MGSAGDQHGAQDAAPREVGGGAAEEAQGRALSRLLRVGHREHRVQGEQGCSQLGVGVVVHRLATDRGHAPQDPGRHGRPAGGREESSGDRRGDGRVHDVLQGCRRPEVEVLVLHLHAGQPQPHEVEHVRDARVGGEQARAAGERSGSLCGEILCFLDPGGTVVTADAAREQCWLPP